MDGLTLDQYISLTSAQQLETISGKMDGMTTYMNNVTTLIYVLIAMLAVMAILMIVVIARMGAFRAAAESDVVTDDAPSAVLPAPVAAPSLPVLQLNGVSEPQAALVMATLADRLQAPIEQLRFVSVAQSTASAAQQTTLVGLSEKTAAFVMAIVADKTQIPLNQLRFKSIKRVN